MPWVFFSEELFLIGDADLVQSTDWVSYDKTGLTFFPAENMKGAEKPSVSDTLLLWNITLCVVHVLRQHSTELFIFN